ncbi:MAG TPA: helix-turn-helix domain-containing protein [Candidatus Hydrogenedentes bacterium]|nr:helix-turn-helix domain-containing protein [Candidatus Hydrogenedentota bacterium]
MKGEGPQAFEALLVEIRRLTDEIHLLAGAVLNGRQAAEYIGISVRNLHTLVRKGKIKRVALSENRFGFRRAELESYAAKNEKAVTDDTEAVVDRLYAEANGD